MVKEPHLTSLLALISENHIETSRLHASSCLTSQQIEYLHLLWLVFGPEVEFAGLNDGCSTSLHTEVGDHLDLSIMLTLLQLAEHLVLIIECWLLSLGK